MCEGLHHVHEAGIVHRDVKPCDVLVSGHGQVLIADLGIARTMGEATITRKGELPGSPYHVSPEYVVGMEMDRRSEVYLLGVVIYQMIVGRVPFDGNAPVATIFAKHRQGTPVLPGQIRPDVPPYLADMAMRCLEKDPANRYQSAREILDRLPPADVSAVGELARLVAESRERLDRAYEEC